MGAPRKYHPHGSVVFGTFSLECGLLLLCNPLCQLILESCLARAISLFPVRLCHFIVHANHIHMVFVVINPVHASKFVGNFKAEVAHRLNIVLGWKKRTVWCEGFDGPVVLTPVRALMAISYLYANVAKDNQEDTIELYPGLSSWRMYQSGRISRDCKFIRRPAFECLPESGHCYAGYAKEAKRIEKSTSKTLRLTLQPDAWLEAFGITDAEEKARWNERLVARVRALEERAREKRRCEGKQVFGRERLLGQPMTLDYRSKRSGKRMWCLSERRSVRIEFINYMKGLLAKAKEVFRRWHVGDYSVPYPSGLFPPPQPRLMEPLFGW